MAYLRKYNISEANTLTKPLNLQDITITPSTETQTYIHDESLAYNGLGVITVEGVNASIDPNIKPENIVEGVNILGVIGTNSGSAGIRKLIERDFTSLGLGDLEGVEKIGSYVFYQNKKMTSIILPSSLKTIDNYAFQQSGITSINIPESVSYLANSAFADCTSLTDVIIRCKDVGNSSVFINCPINSLKLYNTERIKRDFTTSYPSNDYKNGEYLGNEENPYMVFMKPKGEGCEIKENSLIAEGALNIAGLKRVAIPENVKITGTITDYNTPADIIIYCEAESKPDSWHSGWNAYARPVQWGIKKKNYTVDVFGETKVYNGILLSEEPDVPEGNYFWNYYSSNNFIPENIVEIPFYSEEENPPKLYSRIELSEKPDGSTFERAMLLYAGGKFGFSVNMTNGLCWGKFTPTETRSYSFKFDQENGDMCYALRTEENTLKMISDFRSGVYTGTAYNYSGPIFIQDGTTSAKSATLTAGETYYIHWARWNVYGENPQNTINSSANLIIT